MRLIDNYPLQFSSIPENDLRFGKDHRFGHAGLQDAERMRRTLHCRISVIIPVWNTAMYLAECFDSVVTQTGCDFEILCVNDGSDDESGEIILSY